jgi:hypothetical protein
MEVEMDKSDFKAGQRFIAMSSPLAMLLTWTGLWLAWRDGHWTLAATPEGRIKLAEQTLVFALLAGAAVASGEGAARMLPGASGAFLLGSVLFAAGYLAGWRYRAPGMGMTVAANIAMFAAVLL